MTPPVSRAPALAGGRLNTCLHRPIHGQGGLLGTGQHGQHEGNSNNKRTRRTHVSPPTK